MESSHMRFEVTDGIGQLTVDRPEQRNAMTWAMYEWLVDICNVVDGEDRVKVLMISGSGERAFISGTDITQFREFRGDPRAGIEYEERIDAVLERLETVRKPTLAAIRGVAVGGGLEIALSCDLRMAADAARFGIPIARLGNCLSMNGYCRLVALIGAARAKELLYAARLIDAHEARSWGLVSEVVPARSSQTGHGRWPEKSPRRRQSRSRLPRRPSGARCIVCARRTRDTTCSVDATTAPTSRKEWRRSWKSGLHDGQAGDGCID